MDESAIEVHEHQQRTIQKLKDTVTKHPRLFHFNPNSGVGSGFAVLAHSRNEALTLLKDFLKQRSINEELTPMHYYTNLFVQWKDTDLGSLPWRYTLDEYGEGEIADLSSV